MKPLGLIVAVARNGGIGWKGTLPWHIPEDLKRFKALTLNHCIIMGRKTHESIGRPLPGRRNIVVSRNQPTCDGCDVVNSLDAALELAAEDAMPFVIGGEQLYREALPRATHLFLTRVDLDVEADAFFPSWNQAEWEESLRQPAATPSVTFIDLRRRVREQDRP